MFHLLGRIENYRTIIAEDDRASLARPSQRRDVQNLEYSGSRRNFKIVPMKPSHQFTRRTTRMPRL